MKTNVLLKLILILAFFSVQAGIRAQGADVQPEIGIAEHLDSIIPVGITFNNEQKQAVSLRGIIHKPTILILIYFDCPGICPQLLSGVSDAMDKIDMELGKDYQAISVSFNSLDTPEKAAEKKLNFLGKKSRSHASDWVYLTGDSANIHALTNHLGYMFQPAGLDFIHPSCIIILSPDGKVTRYLYGTTFLPFDLKMALIEARKGQSRPTINRVLEYCFNYDPEGRKYTLAVTKISATIIIFLAAVLLIILLIRSGRKKDKTKK